MKFSKLLLLLFLICSCKSKINNFDKDCFYKNDGFLYLNFYNLNQEERLIPNITGILDDNFYLIDNNYILVNDTLQIKLFDKKNIRIADSDSAAYNVIGTIDYIKLKEGRKIQQAFKLDKKFKVISIVSEEENLNLKACN